MREDKTVLPFADAAVVTDEKIIQYLLCLTHPVGRTKAQFFSRFGFSSDFPGHFSDFLKQHAKTGKATFLEVSDYGEKYIVEGSIITPIGKAINLRSVWMIKNEIPYLVTAYPVNK